MTCHRQARSAKLPAYISIAAAAQRGLAPARAAPTAPNCTREKAIARNKKVQARPTAIWKRRRFMPASRKLNFTTALGVSRQVNADQSVFGHWQWPIPRCRRQGHPRSSLDAVQLADSNILAVI